MNKNKDIITGILLGLLFSAIIVICAVIAVKESNTKKEQVSPVIPEADQNEKNCIIEALWYEARGEHEIGIRAVMSVIQNRVKHKNFPKTYCGVIHAPYQFSYRNAYEVGEDVPYPALLLIDSSIQKIADEVMQNKFSSIFDENTLYYTTTKVKPKWTKSMRKVTVIDRHIFYAPKISGTISELSGTKEQ